MNVKFYLLDSNVELFQPNLSFGTRKIIDVHAPAVFAVFDRQDAQLRVLVNGLTRLHCLHVRACDPPEEKEEEEEEKEEEEKGSKMKRNAVNALHAMRAYARMQVCVTCTSSSGIKSIMYMLCSVFLPSTINSSKSSLLLPSESRLLKSPSRLSGVVMMSNRSSAFSSSARSTNLRVHQHEIDCHT